MNLGRMYHGWAGIDPSKWVLMDHYFRIGANLAPHNGRFSDEWGAADLQEAGRVGLTPAQRTARYRQALGIFQHACAVDDLLGDARVYRGQAKERLGLYRQAAASYAQALQIVHFEIFNTGQYPAQPQYSLTVSGPPPAVVEFLTNALYEAHAYKSLVQPTSQLLPPNQRGAGPSYLGQSPMTLAYSPTLRLATSPFSATLQTISIALRQKGLVK